MSSRERIDIKPDLAPTRYYEPVHWRPIYTYICQMYAVMHMTPAEIGQVVHWSPGRIYRILADPRGRIEIQKATDSLCEKLQDVTDQFKLYSPEACAELVRQMREGTKDDVVKQRAATTILDRAGYTPIHKHLNVSTTITDDVAKRLEKAMQEFETIEADYEIVEADEILDSELEQLDSQDITEEEYLRRVRDLRNSALPEQKVANG